jgi:hypothetical protein
LYILNLRHYGTYVNSAVERSIFDGQGTVEINRQAVAEDRTASAETEAKQERRQALGG